MIKYLTALLLGFLAMATNAFAALPAEIETAVTDVSGLWDTIHPIKLGIVIFGLAIAFLLMLGRKR